MHAHSERQNRARERHCTLSAGFVGFSSRSKPDSTLKRLGFAAAGGLDLPARKFLFAPRIKIDVGCYSMKGRIGGLTGLSIGLRWCRLGRPAHHAKFESINAASCDFDNAPRPLVASTLPFLNSISVGMPRMPNLGGVSWFSSILSFCHFQLAAVFLGHVVQDRRDHFAGPAPLGPVIDQYRCVALQDFKDSNVESVTWTMASLTAGPRKK